MPYPKIKDKDFYEKINKKFSKHKIKSRSISLKKTCFPKKYKHQIPQKFLSKYINPKTPYKGVLVFHRLGSGKTCSAVSIGEAWKKHRKIIVVVPASLQGNFRKELRSLCAGNSYITKKERELLEKHHPSSIEYKNIIEISNKRINRHYEIYSYNKFIDYIMENSISFRNKVLIIDEIQNLISEHGVYYKILYKAIKNAPSSLRIVLLSATPMFDKPIEIALTMNLLKLPKEIPDGTKFFKKFIRIKRRKDKIYYYSKNLDYFKKLIKGYVSYWRGAPPLAFPKGKVRYIKCKMSGFQYKSYKTVKMNEDKNKIYKKIKDKKKSDGNLKELPNNFFIGTRFISNVSFPNKYIGEKGYNSFLGENLKLKNLKKYSIKFYRIIKKIKYSTGTIFIYSNFREYGGIKTFVRVLEHYGYKNYLEHKEGSKRFAIWAGDVRIEIKDEILNVFNQKKNYNGSRIKIMLGSPSIKEGVSLLRVQSVHILEPYWNQSRLDQVIGRAIRFCSHSDMEEHKRKVIIYIYIAIHPKEKESIDEYIQKLAFKKNKLIKEFELALKESSFDCMLNKIANVYPDDIEKIKCDK
jgi:superfamily II DNA or RNA helicase